MDKTLKFNKLIDIIFYITLISSLLLLTNGSLIVFATCPILLAIIYFTQNKTNYFVVLLGSLLMGLFFTDIKDLATSAIGLIVISLTFITLVNSKLAEKKQIAISFFVISLIMIGFYKYSMLAAGLDIKSLALKLKEAIETTRTYDITDEIYQQAVSMYPAILAGFGLIYSVLGLKVIRNYMAYKNLGSDMSSLNSIRITKRDAIIILIICIAIFLTLSFLGMDRSYIYLNLGFILAIMLLLNGISIYDYLMTKTRSPIGRGLQWVFVVLFFSLFSVVFIFFGIFDIFFDMRKNLRRPDAKK